MSTSSQGLSFGLKKRSAKSASTFALPPPPQDLNQPDAGPSKQYITVVGDYTERAANAAEGVKVIPAQKNSYKIGGKPTFVPSFVPDGDASLRGAKSGEDRFESAVAVKQEDEPVKYGLNLREEDVKPDIKLEEGFIKQEVKLEPGVVGPAMWTKAEREEQSYLNQMDTLPDEASQEGYEGMPVDGFGMALLRGMDWKEGDPVGRNKGYKAMEVVEFVPRDSRLGLGAKPSALTGGKKRKHKEDMVLPTSSDGRIRSIKTLDEKLVPRSSLGVHPGKRMCIAAGRHLGMHCQVLELLKVEKGHSARASVRLVVNDEVVTVRVMELKELKDEKKAKEKVPSKNRRDQDEERGPALDPMADSRDTKRRSSDNGSHSKVKYRERHDADERSDPSWLHSGIRVRIIDKKMKKGRYYLKKGLVDDVLSPGIANVAMEDSREVLEAVHQTALETVVPKKQGASVLFLRGSHKGQQAVLLDKRTEKGVAAVQLKEDMSVVRVHLDDIAEFVGSDEGV